MKAPPIEHTPEEWRHRGSFLRQELRRHDLSFREMILAELILDKTYGWRRAEIIFPQLRYFTDFTGIDETDIVKILDRLVSRKIVRIVRVKGWPTYSIRADTEVWKALPRVTRETMQATTNLMRECNHLEPIPLEKDTLLNFKVRPNTVKSAAKMGDLPMGQPTGQHISEPMLNLT